jgi:hypothetical protein
MMTTESLLAVALWMDELEAQRDAAAREKWAAIDEMTLDQGNTSLQAYVDRDAELDAAMVKPLRDRLEQARKLLETRAAEIAPRESWPAGGSWLSRAYALAKSGLADADPLAVEAELAALRRG